MDLLQEWRSGDDLFLCLNLLQCFFPQNRVPDITTPTFLLNAAYDVWQVCVYVSDLKVVSVLDGWIV